jgi:uncharacterized circularly permuted ATP-grasp superfamily protein
MIARPDDCATLLRAIASGRVCMANALRCKIPHKKAFFAVLTDDRNDALFPASERAMLREHIPWTRVLEETRTTWNGQAVDLVPFVRKTRESLVVKPNDEYGGSGVTLGWESSEAAWDAAIARALSGSEGAWVVQERIAIRREPFPAVVASPHGIEMRDMLVDFAPYLFRGRQYGYLTRLSSSGLANVTSGGGQTASFVVRERRS